MKLALGSQIDQLSLRHFTPDGSPGTTRISSDLLTSFSEFERDIVNQKSRQNQFQQWMANYRGRAKDIFGMVDGHIANAGVTNLGEKDQVVNWLSVIEIVVYT